ncbi:MAG: adenylyltransferase [Patescibacteria group bacterium]|nr:adenylyltransferase [Patescibacteria group bacterium]
MKKFVNEDNTRFRRGSTYTKVIADIAQKNVCPFCEDQLLNFHKNPIEKKKYWIVTDNMYPYKPNKKHILLIHQEHIEHAQEISTAAWQELQVIIQEQTKKNNIDGGTFMLRFGDGRYTGSSVRHLHAHIVQSDPEHEDYKKEVGLVARIG